MPPYGSTRNLTQQFIRLRNEARRLQGVSGPGQSDKATEKLISAALGSSSDVEAPGPASTSSVVPVWVQQSERVRVEMNLVKERLTKLKEYHAKALLVTFEGESEAQVHAEALTRELQQSFKRIEAAIRVVGHATGSGDDMEVRQQVQKQLASALLKLSLEFRREQTRFLNKVEQQKGLEAGSSIGIVEAEEGTRSGAEVVDPGFTTAQLAMVDISTDLIHERDTEIRKIVETIAELAQIMRDLMTLVVEQGTMLDRIDHNVTQTAAKVDDGVKQLAAAETTQKRGRMYICIIALICLIVLMLIIVIIRHI